MSSNINTATIKALVLVNITKSQSIKVNKLRKLICNAIPSCSWDEFGETLESMKFANTVVQADDGALTIPGITTTPQTAVQQKVEEEIVIAPLPKSSSKKVLKPTIQQPPPSPFPEGAITVTTSSEVHLDIVKHLRKESKKKWYNIEVNTKCTLEVQTKSKDLCTVIVRGETEKRLMSAMVFINALKKAYIKNPSHFGANETGGGTLEEQKLRQAKLSEKKKSIAAERIATKNVNKLFVGGLEKSVTTEELRSHFSAYGEVADAIVKTDMVNGRSKGFGFVRFASEEGFEKVINNAKTHKMNGKAVVLKIANDPGPPGTGSGTGSGTAKAKAKERTGEKFKKVKQSGRESGDKEENKTKNDKGDNIDIIEKLKNKRTRKFY